MKFVKHKIVSGFPCNNEAIFMIITEDYGSLTTTNKEEFEKVMKDGYIELQHNED